MSTRHFAIRRFEAFVGTLFLLALSCFRAPAQDTVLPGTQEGAFIREWLLCGPFPSMLEKPEAARSAGLFTDFLAGSGGEPDAQPSAGAALRYAGNDFVWRKHSSSADAIDLDSAMSQDDFQIAYAYCEIDSAEARPVVMAIGTNDGARVWLNGEEILSAPDARGLFEDDDLIPVVLVAGRNRLLLKIEERGNKWAFMCRVLPFDEQMIAEKLRLFQVVSKQGGRETNLRFVQPLSLVGPVVKGARLEVVAFAEEQPVWTGAWSGSREMPLPLDAPQYGEYTLNAEVDFAGGSVARTRIPFAAGPRIEHVLFDHGKTKYRVIVGQAEPDGTKWAARELSHWLGEVSGAKFPVKLVSDNSRPIAGPALAVGPVAAHAIAPAREFPQLPNGESLAYENAGPNVLLTGNGERGAMYTVMSFLERELGVRWYTPHVTVAPQKDRHAFVVLKHSESPGIRVRNDFYFEAFEPIWAARNRINGAMGWREQPGGVEAYWRVHTFFPLMPPEEFFDAHPEYYSLIDGKRSAERTQFCLTNPDVLRIMIDRVKAAIREEPQYLIYCVSQNDWGNPCECANCQAIAAREDSESGPLIAFVNQVAEAVQGEFPDKFIGTLAYQYTRKPPKTLIPRENVVIRLCSIESCFSHPLSVCPENQTFVEDIQRWARIAPHMYIWDYVVNFSHYTMPYPNFAVLKPNLQFFRDHNAIGIMEQAAYQSRGGEWAELRAYVLAKLLWNPETDVEACIDDFIFGYYGRSGQYVRQYFDLLHAQVTPERHIHLGLRHDDPLFSDEFVREAESLFDTAEKIADNEDIRRRVEMARLPLMYLKCKRMPLAAKQDGTYARLLEISKREKVTLYAEAGEPHRAAFFAEMEAAE